MAKMTTTSLLSIFNSFDLCLGIKLKVTKFKTPDNYDKQHVILELVVSGVEPKRGSITIILPN
jgi:hypothetical protein